MMTTFTTEDRIEVELLAMKVVNMPTVIIDSGASYEPVPFAGMMRLDEEESNNT